MVDRSLKPTFNFEKSSIKSLAKDMEDFLSQGVKMATHEHQIVEERALHSKEMLFRIKEEDIVKEKPKKKK